MQLIVLSTAIFAAIQTVSAHGSIKYPKPILFDENRNNYNAPLDPEYTNFPCKGFHTQPFNSAETWKAGQEAHFEIDMSNIAAHGGGSCQASISHDGGKTFEVLHSFIGDCPRGANGNTASGDQIFKFMIPEDEPAGEAIFAWTWFAAIANREMYMNCAFVTIENDNPVTQVSPRPPMFVGLLAGGGKLCTVEERSNLQFPEPGKFVTDGSQNPTAQYKGKALPSGPSCGNAETGGGEPILKSLPPNSGLVGGGPIAGPKPAPVNPIPVIEDPINTTTAVVTPPMQSTTLNVVYVTKTIANPVVAVVTVTATMYVPPAPTGNGVAKRHEHVARDQSCSFEETLKIGNECPVPSTMSSQWQPCVWQEFCPCLDDNLSPFDIVNFSQIKGHCDCLTKGIGCTGGLRTRHMRRHTDHSAGVDIILRRDEDPMIHTFKA